MGLGVKDLRTFISSLLTKWRWRLKNRENDAWKEVLLAKYGDASYFTLNSNLLLPTKFSTFGRGRGKSKNFLLARHFVF